MFTITEPSSPALCEIVNNGASSALRIIEAPVFSSPSKLSTNSATFLEAWIYAEPPPAIIPSSTAALVAFKASSILSLFSCISGSVAAPTLITATPPANLASLSCNFSLSNSDVVSSNCALICATLPAISSEFPRPSTIIVFSFATLTDLALPKSSILVSASERPNSSEIT